MPNLKNFFQNSLDKTLYKCIEKSCEFISKFYLEFRSNRFLAFCPNSLVCFLDKSDSSCASILSLLISWIPFSFVLHQVSNILVNSDEFGAKIASFQVQL